MGSFSSFFSSAICSLLLFDRLVLRSLESHLFPSRSECRDAASDVSKEVESRHIGLAYADSVSSKKKRQQQVLALRWVVLHVPGIPSFPSTPSEDLYTAE
jgi:hypothetical protein